MDYILSGQQLVLTNYDILTYILAIIDMAGQLLPVVSNVYIGNVFYSDERSERE